MFHRIRRVLPLLLALIILACTVPSAEAAEGIGVSTAMYGRDALAELDNAKALLYAYDQIVAGVENCEEEISVYDGSNPISQAEIMTVMDAYGRDYTYHFWMGNSYTTIYNTATVLRIGPTYTITGTALESAKEAFYAAAGEILSGIHSGMSDYDKELYLHEKLAGKVTYIDGVNSHNAYGALVEGRAVCEGYAEAFQYLLQRAGIQSFIIEGGGYNPTTGRYEAHAWNAVKIDGKFYQVDLTWDDQGSEIYHCYFNISESMMLEDHVIAATKYALPVCSSTDAFYFNVTGGNLDSYTAEKVGALLRENRGKAHVYIPGDVNTFLSWFNANILDIAAEAGVNGGFSYQYSVLGREVVLEIPELQVGDANIDKLIAELPAVSDPMGTEYYFYNQLSEIEKVFYWAMAEATWENPEVIISGLGSHSEDQLIYMARRALAALMADDPEYHMYWLRAVNGVLNEGVFTASLYQFPTVTEYHVNKALARAQQIVETVGMEGDRYSRLRDLLELMYEEMEYNRDLLVRTPEAEQYEDSLYGCLLHNVAVCGGFSDTVKYLCDKLEIPCIIVHTQGSDAHAWNYVQMEDGKWYSIDAARDEANTPLSGWTGGVYGEWIYQSSAPCIVTLYNVIEDFRFPSVAETSYVYDGVYEPTYNDADNTFEETAPAFLYRVNPDGISCTITGHEGLQSGDLIIPETIDGYTVTEIGAGAFLRCSGFTGDLIIPDTVTKIGDGAFAYAGLVGDLIIPDSVTRLEASAFQGCAFGGELYLPESLEYIGSRALAGSSSTDDTTHFSNVIDLTNSDIQLEKDAFLWTVFPDFYCNCNSEYIEEIISNASCGSDGFARDYCSNCAGTRFKTLDALDHDYGQIVVEQAPTLLEAGCLKAACTACGDIVSVVMPKLNDVDYIYNVTKEPTSTEEGIGTYSWKDNTYGIYEFTVVLDKLAILWGDVNDDGRVNTQDRLVLTRYLAKWTGYEEDTINLIAADVNCDGKVNAQDRLILTRYLAKWSGYEALPYVKN